MVYSTRFDNIERGELCQYKEYECCYMFLDDLFTVLYVGRTVDFYNRYLQHCTNSEKLEGATKLILLKSDNTYEDEIALVEYFEPPHNKQLGVKNYTTKSFIIKNKHYKFLLELQRRMMMKTGKKYTQSEALDRAITLLINDFSEINYPILKD